MGNGARLCGWLRHPARVTPGVPSGKPGPFDPPRGIHPVPGRQGWPCWQRSGRANGTRLDQCAGSHWNRALPHLALFVEHVRSQEQKPPSLPTEQVTQARFRKKEVAQPVTSGNCTFSRIVPVSLQRFGQSGVSVVQCPGCGRAWSFSPSSGVLRFKAQHKRKANTPNSWQRRTRGERETDENVVGG